ncbi:MAG: outer membrane protein assembly factor BamD [Gammaproteobacteria bacterium]|nr:outer membrane protein assembly factor BamD [Gammaproteobacteria bacterium]
MFTRLHARSIETALPGSLGRLALLLALAMALGACASKPDDYIEPADVLYAKANEALVNNNFPLAADRLNTIMARYPFTPYAVQAHLDSLYAMHQLDQADMVGEEAERFIRENPRHPAIDYAYYMKGVAYYRDPPNVLERVFDVDAATRDVDYARKSFANFRDLILRYPDSKYSVDARQRMLELKYRLARHEIHVADYYIRRGAWMSAIRRANRVLEDFQGTPAEVDALMILVKGYTELGIDDLVAQPRAVLAANPDRQPAVLPPDFLDD